MLVPIPHVLCPFLISVKDILVLEFLDHTIGVELRSILHFSNVRHGCWFLIIKIDKHTTTTHPSAGNPSETTDK